MNKEQAITEIEGKIDTGKSVISISYIIGTRFWVERMRLLTMPAEITISSATNHHVMVINNPSQIATRYTSDETLNNDSVNIIRLGILNMLNQVFEIIKEYAKENNQYELFRQQPWFIVMLHLRNAFNHNFNFMGIKATDNPNYIQFSNYRIELTPAMNETEIDFDVLPISCTYELADMMLESFRNNFT
jgi:hypothetical protein